MKTPNPASSEASTNEASTVTPALALQALDAARSAILNWQAQSETQLAAHQGRLADTETRLAQTQVEAQRAMENLQQTLLTAQSEAVAAHKSLDITRGELAQAKTERDALREDCSAFNEQVRAHQTEIEKQQNEIVKQQSEIEEKQQKIEVHQREIAAQQQTLDVQNTQLEKQIARNGSLHTELLEMYRDLHAVDLPSLILRICLNLTGAENGLFVEADGDGILSDVGLHDLPPVVQEELFKWTRRAAQSEEPIVQNDGTQLADGQGLINLAALPVAVQSTLKGVILVCNKRSGPFTDEDTETLLSIGKHAGVALENRRLHHALSESFLSTIAVLADAIEAKDPYTRGHCESVANVAVKVAQRMGLKGEDLDHIRYAALLHDIGKIGIPDGILLKPGRLLSEEFSIIQRHASIGSDLVSRVPSLMSIAPIILHHHERIDGSGYPDGLNGDAISLASRIVGVVDAFDAMTTPRPYREPVGRAEALAELQRCAGDQFDVEVVRVVGEVLQDTPM